MLFQNASDFYRNKNKRKSQRIHKRHNKIQYASKHYGSFDNDIIFKRKNPVKQRKDRKKFKTQRRRKKIYKQMSFDFEDFLYRNKWENFKRIQIKPVIKYQSVSKSIPSIYNSYYNPNLSDLKYSTDCKRYSKKNKQSKKTCLIDGITVTITYYPESYWSEQPIDTITSTINVYGMNNFPGETQTHSLSKIQGFEDLNIKYRICDINHKKIAKTALQNSAYLPDKSLLDHCWTDKNIEIYPRHGRGFTWLRNIFNVCIGDLAFIFEYLFAYIGYRYVTSTVVKVKWNVSIKKHKHKNSNNGIWHSARGRNLKTNCATYYGEIKDYYYSDYNWKYNSYNSCSCTYCYAWGDGWIDKSHAKDNCKSDEKVNLNSDVQTEEEITKINIKTTMIFQKHSVYEFVMDTVLNDETCIPEFIKINNLILKECTIYIEDTAQENITRSQAEETMKHSMEQPIINKKLKPMAFNVIPTTSNKQDNNAYIAVYSMPFGSDIIHTRFKVPHYQVKYGVNYVYKLFKEFINNPNKQLFGATIKCIEEVLNIPVNEMELQYNNIHEPICNLLPLSCSLQRILFKYIASNDILRNVLIPYVGYDLFYYIVLDGTKIINSNDIDKVYKESVFDNNNYVCTKWKYCQPQTPDTWYNDMYKSNNICLERESIELSTSSCDPQLFPMDNSSTDSSESLSD